MYKRDSERYKSLEIVEKIVGNIVKNNSKSFFYGESPSSVSNQDTKKILTSFHSKQYSMNYFKSANSSPRSYHNLEISFKKKKTPEKILKKPKTSSLTKKPSDSPIHILNAKLKRLPPPNFMKILRERPTKYTDPRVLSSAKKRNFSL
jgi:hypothetical protein